MCKKVKPTEVKISGVTYKYLLTKKGKKLSLGEGGSGNVFLVESNGRQYAIKEYSLSDNKSKKKLTRDKKEINFLGKLNNECPNIIKIYGSLFERDKLYMVMDVYKYTLRDVINRNNSVDELLNIILQIVNGIKYIHSLGIIHRDLKPENILLDETNNVVLCDFGIAHFPDARITSPKEFLANKNYMPPEAHIIGNSCNVTTAFDIYSLGKIINELFTRENPVGTSYSKIGDLYPEFIGFDKLIERMLNQNPDERPAIDAVKRSLLYEIETYNNNVEDIQSDIWERSGQPKDKNAVIKLASQELFRANQLFKYLDNDQFEMLNMNYHCNIRFSATSEFKNLYFLNQVLEICKRKFDYESNRYDRSFAIENQVTESNYNEFFKHIADKTKIPYGFNDFTGLILKTFSSCTDYHCEEILKGMVDIQSDTDALSDVPLIYFIKKSKDCFSHAWNSDDIHFEEYLDCLLEESSITPHIDPRFGYLWQIDPEYEAIRANIHQLLIDEYKCDVRKGISQDIVLFSPDNYASFRLMSIDKATLINKNNPNGHSLIVYDAESVVRLIDSTNTCKVIELNNWGIRVLNRILSS